MKSLTLVTCVLIGALNFAGCSRKSPQAGPPAPEVLVIEPATRDVPVDREWVGSIDGSENADIRAHVTGHLIKRDYIEGSLVKKGDLLFEIDPRPFEAALAKAKGNLENARAPLSRKPAVLISMRCEPTPRHAPPWFAPLTKISVN
jgi:membrane fusion protein, multidrug efflux system